MARAIVVDTDVLIDYLRGHPKAIAFIQRHADEMAVSSISLAELYAGVRDGRERAVLDELVTVFRVIPVSAHLAREGGLLKRDFGPAHGVGLADAIIAATALDQDADLATLNVKHFPMLQWLKPPYRKR